MSDKRTVRAGQSLEDLVATRRTFLQVTGFGAAAAALSACSRATVEKAIPLLVRDERIVPGRGYSIATTCGGCPAGCGVLVKCRDGRPVKLEGNPEQPVGQGGLCAVGQAQVLSLYDSHRLDGPRRGRAKLSWPDADAEIAERLSGVRREGGRVRVLTGTVTSPSTIAAIGRFCASFGDGRHVSYDPVSCSAIAAAHEQTHGVRALPRVRLERARVVAAFDADFLGTWISPVELTRSRQLARDPATPHRFLRHVQLEPRMTLTGSRADQRVRVAPWEIGEALAELCRRLDERAASGASAALGSATGSLGEELRETIGRLAAELWAARGEAAVLCGVNDLRVQKLAVLANELLGAYGRTLDLAAPSRQRLGDDLAFAELRRELDAGEVAVLVVAGCNPACDAPHASALVAAIRRVPLVIACPTHDDETAELARYALPVPHFLECFDDAEPVAGVLALSQPAAPALRSTRTLRRTLATWCGDPRDDRALVQEAFEEIASARGAAGSAKGFEQALHDGFALLPSGAPPPGPFRAAAVEPPAPRAPPPAAALTLVLHPSVAIPDGSHAHNPWLLELPDPVTKVVWDNVAAIAPATARRLGIGNGDVIRLAAAAGPAAPGAAASIELPAWIQPGQHDGVVAVALGFGRKGTDRFTRVGPEWSESRATVEPGGRVGVNAAPLLAVEEGLARPDLLAVRVEKTGRRVELACTQDHHSLEVPEHLAPDGGEVRDAARSVTLADLVADPEHALDRTHLPPAELWADDHASAGPRWGMAIDLSACTGCSACVVGCQAENNVPVVGRDEVRRHREMHWIRIDRYWQGDPAEPTTLHQPMMCQQCGHAPCETVCPVLATVHSRDGLNQQVYNRCVGTRYCANNCPYKVRRFNWFDYPREDRLANLALNPDVTVRSRGVMEKCSFCVQRVIEARMRAAEEGRPLADGDVEPACQQSCPAQAIVFGDLSDPESRVSRLARDARAYSVLEDLNVQPSVRYLAHVRAGGGGGDGA